MSEFLEVQRDVEDAKKPRPKHPTGWEPGVDTGTRTVTFLKDEREPPSPDDWATIITELGLPADQWTVDPNYPVQVRSWDSGLRRQFYYRATITPLSASKVNEEIDLLLKDVRKRKPRKKTYTHDKRAFVVCLSDWQAGKPDGGGHQALIDRLTELREAVPERIRQLKKMGKPVDHLYIVGMGDMVESCDGHYSTQTFSVTLDGRQQVKLVRRMLYELITHWSNLAPQVVVGCVPGNHGESRKNGKAYTTFEDNDDLAVFEQVHEILSENPDAYGHIRWVIPDGDMTITLDLANSGYVASFAHGHQAKSGGGGPQNKLKNWWEGKMSARHPVGDADLLVSGHYHHLQVVQDGPRTWMQCPANDGGSRWFEEAGGPTTVCGTLTFVTEPDGWSELAIL